MTFAAGLTIGLGAGMTGITLLFCWLMVGGMKQRTKSDKEVKELLIRKAEAVERIAEIMEESK